MFSNEKVAKSSKFFSCIKCDYITEKKYNFDKHILTAKHQSAMFSNEKVAKSSKLSQIHICSSCNKTYKDYSGLWRHKQKCSNNVKNILESEKKQQQLVEYLLKENSDFKQLMIDQNKNILEIAKNSGNNNNNNNNSNNTNNFNLQFFLNETCKDAMNIMDFVNQLSVSIKDLEETGQLGFTEGISKIFINGLKQINIPDRPIHCSDLKRETIYIKSNNEWNKETEDKLLLTNAIKHVAHKNIKQITEWTKDNPEYNDSDSKQNDKYLKIVSNSMNGSTKEESEKNYNKIIKNIVKETIIDK
jgi:hypothetical protein